MADISPHTEDPQGPLASALLREHHEIDAGIEAFAASAASTTASPVTPEAMAEWARPLTDAMTALRRHIYLEEVIVFPKIRQGALMMAVMVMIREHGELWRAMDALDAQLASVAAASGTSGAVNSVPDPDALVADCRGMLELLERHNMKEEPVIYPHLDTDLDGPTERLLSAFLVEGEMPEGWVCEAAR
ncbi:hemerythrin domain-containing protein [Leucobacter sp. HY1908]